MVNTPDQFPNSITHASSGLHTNGYSLARKIFFEQLKLKPRSHVPELRSTIGDELLKVHVSYGPLVQKLIQRLNVGQASSLSPSFRAEFSAEV